jgi:hypothetical protein
MPGIIRSARAANAFKIGLFIALSGPASLFAPTVRRLRENDYWRILPNVRF